MTLGLLDRVLVMTVNPGFGGQAFIPEMLQKVRALAEMRAAHGLRFEIGVDGGVNADTVALVAKAGADTLIAGSAVFHHPEGLADAVAELRRLANEAVPNDPHRKEAADARWAAASSCVCSGTHCGCRLWGLGNPPLVYLGGLK